MPKTARTALAVFLLLATGTIPAGTIATAQEAEAPADPAAAGADTTQTAEKPKGKECQPGFGCVTNLPLPRYVTLKTSEGNARRGPGLSHRIDWVFTRVGMPLRVTAEYENWRRVEDSEGAGGWMHYALLSGTRAVLVAQDMAEFRSSPRDDASVILQAEAGVVARVVECQIDWCRLSIDGERGWLRKTALWGVEPGELIE